MNQRTIKVGMDARPLLNEGSGVGYYIKRLVSSLALFSDIHFKLFSSSFKNRFVKNEHFENLPIDIFDIPVPVTLFNFMSQKFMYPPIENLIAETDILHTPHCYYIPSKCQNQIITIHDLFHLKEPGLTRIEKPEREFKIIKRSAERAKKIIAVSNFTKKNIIEILGIPGDKIEVIYSAPSLFPNAIEKSKKNDSAVKTILTVGTLERRKNYLNLLEAFKIAKKRINDIKLIVVGKDGLCAKEIKSKAYQMKMGEKETIFTGYVKEMELINLYNNADLFVFPSLEEGFGFPPLDAMNFGVPVISSKTGSLPEILMDAPYYIDCHDPESIAEAILEVLEDDELRENMILKGEKVSSSYSWKSTAERTYKLYRKILGFE